MPRFVAHIHSKFAKNTTMMPKISNEKIIIKTPNGLEKISESYFRQKTLKKVHSFFLTILIKKQNIYKHACEFFLQTLNANAQKTLFKHNFCLYISFSVGFPSHFKN